MASVIFAGSSVKTLKRDLLFNEAGVEYASIFNRNVSPPNVVPTAGNPGSILIDIGTGQIWRKLDSGSSTNWIPIESIDFGGRVVYDQISGNSPIPSVEQNFQLFLFSSGLAQELYFQYRVPDHYVTGKPIVLRQKVLSPDTSGNILLRAQATLIRAADEYSSTSNQRTTTNSAITMSASNDNLLLNADLDLTSSTGQINSQAVAAGDIISGRVYRDTDTAASDLRLFPNLNEVSLL